MFRKFFAALALAALLAAGFTAFAGTPAQANPDRTPCVKVINGVEIRTCEIVLTAPAATPDRRHTRLKLCSFGPIKLRVMCVLRGRPIPR